MSSYSVEAILRAKDSGFSSTFKNAEKSVTGLTDMASKVGSTFKSMLGANILGGAISAGIGALSNQFGGLVGDINSSSKAWQTFQGNMENLGLPKQEIAGVKKELQTFATETIYSASDMASTYSQLKAVGISSTKELVTGFGGLAAAAENPAQAMKTLSTQAVQMAAKPNVAWADFKLMLEQTPAGISAVAKHMGMSTAEMVAAVQDGKIATEDFFEAINAVGNSDTFKEMAKEYKTVDQAIDGLTEGVSNKLLPAFETLSKYGIKAVEGIIGMVDKFDGDGFASQIDKWVQSFQGVMKSFGGLGVFNNLKATIDAVGGAFKSAFTFDPGVLNTAVVVVANFVNLAMYNIQDLASAVSDLFQGFSKSGAINALVLAFYDLSVAGLDLSEKLSGSIPWDVIGEAAGHVVKFLAQIVSAIAEFSQTVSGDIFRGLLIGIPAAIAGFKAFSFLKSFNPFGFFKNNASSGMSAVSNAVSKGKNAVGSLLTNLGNLFKSIGQGIALAARGIGSGIATAFRGIGQALMLLNPAQILSFGAAVGIAAIGIGAGVAIIAAGFALLATQSGGISQIILALGSALGELASTIIGALAQAFVTIAPHLPMIATAFAQLSPLVTATGEAIANIISAFSTLAPVISAFGQAFSAVITSIGTAVAEIITAATPLVEVLGNIFTTTVQIITGAIVQIVQALAPFIPALTEMVIQVAPHLASIVESFSKMFAQISPIIDSLTGLLETFGEQVSSILESARGVVESFGKSIRNILDGVAGIFDSMGNAALNAGKGVKLMAQGIKMLVDLNLGDLIATLGATATGLGSMAAHAGGMSNLGSAMTQVGTGMALFATGAIVAVTAMTTFGTSVSTLQASLAQLPSLMTTAATGFSSFTAQAVAGVSGLSAINGPIAAFKAQLMTITPALLSATVGFAGFSVRALAMVAGLTVLGGLIGGLVSRLAAVSSVTSQVATSFSSASSSSSNMSSTIASGMSRATTAVVSGMRQMVSVVLSSAVQMTQAGQQAGRGVSTGVTAGIRGGIGLAGGAMYAMMTAIRDTGMQGVGSMQYIGSMIGQGLAQGMYSALGSVTAAANALVAQAERAARAKAQIHSPARLFRDRVGIYIGQGVAVGIDMSQKYVDKAMTSMFDSVDSFNAQVSGLMDENLAYSFNAGQFSGSVEVAYRKQDAGQLEVIKEALSTIKDLVTREVVLNVDGQEVARTTGDAMTEYQRDKQQLEELLRGRR